MQIKDLELIKTRDERDMLTWWFRIEAPEHNALKVSIYYSKGGYSGIDWTLKPRGYYVSVRPVMLADGFERSSIYGKDSGGYVFIEETKRFNRKRLEQLEAMAVEKIAPYVDNLLSLVAA